MFRVPLRSSRFLHSLTNVSSFSPVAASRPAQRYRLTSKNISFTVFNMLTFTKSGGKKIAAVLFVFSLSLSLFAQAALSSQSSQSLQHPDIEPLFTVQIY